MGNAGVAELADAQDLKSCCRNTVPVRFRSPALYLVGYGPRCRELESSRARMQRDMIISCLFF